MKLKTPAIVAISLAIGIAGGAGVTAIAAQPNMQQALDHLIAADAFLARATDNKGGHKAKARSLVSLAIKEVKAGIRYAN